MGPLPSIVIIWCDLNFEDELSYQSMKDDFSKTTGIISYTKSDDISWLILCEKDTDEFRLKTGQLITVRTSDEAMQIINQHVDKKIFFISSGSIGRYLVPEIIDRYPQVHDFYILAHNINLHVDWIDGYYEYLKIFDHPTDLLLRLTRDISSYYIKVGQVFLQLDALQDALACFNHARNLENYANQRDKMDRNIEYAGKKNPAIEFRHNLDRLEGENGLINQVQMRVRELGYPLES